jgi:hypothetical protein
MSRANEVETAAEPPIDECSALEQRKLELEIKQLSARWFLTPSILAPMATICAALLGLLWAGCNGFFDVSRRELDVRKREIAMDIRDLTQQRDRQTKAFVTEVAKRESEIQRLRLQVASSERQVKSLQAESAKEKTRLLQLDQPVTTAWVATGGDHDATIMISGLNLGTTQGKIQCNPSLDPKLDCRPAPDGKSLICTSPSYTVTSDLCTIAAWFPNRVEARVDTRYLRQVIKGRKSLDVWITRSDGKSSNPQEIVVPESWESDSSK